MEGWFRMAGGTGLIALAILLGVPGAAAGQTTLERVGTYSQPVHVASDPDDPERLFVAERAGRIQLTTPVGTSEFVDLTPVVTSAPGGERGLLSVAFPPDHSETGLLYVFYTGSGGALTVAELESEGGTADPESLRVVLTIAHPLSNHNGGQLHFGPDDYLYISTGDGGGAGDPDQNGQDLTTLLGAILRIDPRQSGDDPYTIPASNPYAGTQNDPVPGARDEIWSWGLRNPWRFSFDRETGALTIGDVGQGAREEIDYRPQELGGGAGDNFGWNCREGSIAYGSPSPACEDTGPDFTEPVFDYPHAGTGGCSITGGYVVRDPSLADLYGRYLYADHCVGDLRSIELEVPRASDDRSEELSVSQPTSFGEDACGRLYVASLAGAVYRLVGDEEPDCGGPDDTTPPTTSVELNGGGPEPIYDGPVTATFSATDEPGGSGVEATEYSLDGGGFQLYDPLTPPTISSLGPHTIEYRSTDNAGNVEETKSAEFEIVHIDPPALRLTVEPRRTTVKPGKLARFTAAVSNAGDGPAQKVRVCAQAPRAKLRVVGKDCVGRASLGPSARIAPRFELRPKRSARGKRVRVTFTASAAGLGAERTTATVKVKRRS
jgi:glucose/arabinose dehydrogenase